MMGMEMELGWVLFGEMLLISRRSRRVLAVGILGVVIDVAI